MNPINNRIIEFESKVLTTLLFDGGYVSFTKSGTGTNATFTPISLLHHLGYLRRIYQ